MNQVVFVYVSIAIVIKVVFVCMSTAIVVPIVCDNCDIDLSCVCKLRLWSQLCVFVSTAIIIPVVYMYVF